MRTIKWINLAKFLGILAIYIGHFIEAEHVRIFVFIYHVPLFFLLSGCTENFNKEKNIKKYIIKQTKGIIVPFFFFYFLSIFLNTIISKPDTNILISWFNIIKNGAIRNSGAGALWFLTCLYLVKIIFYIISLSKNRYVILLLSALLHIISNLFIKPCPIIEPHWFWNLDSALYYILYFSIGYVSYPFINSLFQLDHIKKKVLFLISFIISTSYSFLLLSGHDLLSVMDNIYFFSVVKQYLAVIILIWMNLVLARLLDNNDTLNNIGCNTLYLCGSETLIKIIVPYTINIIGFNILLQNPLSVCIYSFILIVIACKILVPVEKKILMRIR